MAEEKLSKNNQSELLAENAYLLFSSQIFPIKKPVIKIGRKLDNDLVIQESAISRYHAEIKYEENQFVLYDLNSTCGTFLNNKRVNKDIMFAGDIILLCNVPIMFMAEGASLKKQTARETGKLAKKSSPNPEQSPQEEE
jgi:pSer/pThr/pTyr-binding forkhead associated (FHA) protein